MTQPPPLQRCERSAYSNIPANCSDGTEQGIRAGQNIRTEHQKFLVVRTEHWSEHQNILNKILIKLLYIIFLMVPLNLEFF